ncbi:hypothetical protein ABI59_14025 [Acidobacteria bacterium Mor1]|nr:hypothetical protein ABI59_14025 [Acidobacteria bacterium Mor1]
MQITTFAVLALAVLLFGLVSRRAERSILTPPIAFVALGALAGMSGLGWLELDVEDEVIHTLAEITLVLILFTDAARINIRTLFAERQLPIRMLLVGLPLTVAFGAGVAAWMHPGWSIYAAAVLATILAPTDAALGQAVVSNKSVPLRIRQSLNVESGLNDGLALPLLLVFMSACAAGHSETPTYWILFGIKQVTLGPLAGIAVGVIGGKLILAAVARQWMNHTFQELSSLSLAVLAFAGAELIGGNGFIAAFVAGMALGNTASDACESLLEFGEAEGQLLTLLVFTLFGALMLPPALAHAEAMDWVYAVLALTLFRMVPVALSLIGAGLRPRTVLFLGWFGPRGLATVLFALLVLEESMVSEAEAIGTVAYLTVALSVLLHGITAYPLADRFGRWMAGLSKSEEEHKQVTEMPARIRM